MIQKVNNIKIQRIKKYAWAISFFWLFIIVLSLMWNLYSINNDTKEIAKSEARANFNKDQAIRIWATTHGGIYVPMNERTPANPSLSHIPDRNIVKPNGDTLTLMNPAYMIRQMFDEFPIEYGAVGRIVSLKPLNPNNTPDEWERKALLSFEKGEKERFEFSEINGEEYLRLIQPMITKKGCLKCHAFQGYTVGDIRGGVGVSIKMFPLLQANGEQKNTLFFFHLLILFVGFVGLWVGSKQTIKKAIAKLEADELLFKSEEKFRSLFSEMADGVFLHEIIYNQKGEAIDYRILESNSASEKHLNIKHGDANGKLATEFYGTEEAPYLDIYAKVARKGITFTFEEYFQPLKKHFHIYVYSQEKGKFATIFSDITERKQSKLIIQQQNEQLKELNKSKDKFFSVIAHDLKSPFNSIIGFSNLLVEQAEKKDFDGVEKYAGIIEQSSNRAMDLLMNLMEWSQSQTGRMEFNPEYFELVGLIKDTELLLSGAVKQKSISITINVPSNVPAYADKKMISTVLRNLISNAIKFTHPEGKISISVEEKQAELLISVSDTGVGISKVDNEKLFKIDQTYSTSGTKNEKGTGLGLILCKDFVEKHGGKIWAESEEGKGSTFYFTIPRSI